MTNNVKINSLQIENVKRVKAFALSPSATGLTVIGGNNGQGKSSVLHAIAWALGGGKMAPSKPKRDDSMQDPAIDIKLSNGLHVVRKGKNSALTVLDPSGQRAGQQLLDEFVSQFALDLSKFLHASDRDRANLLLQVLGIGDQLAEYETQEKALYNQRHAIGQIATSKRKHADELPEYADAPDEPVSASELIKRQQSILAKNGENQRKRERKAQIETELATVREQIAKLQERQTQLVQDLADACKSAEDLRDESTTEIEESLGQIEAINQQVAANQQKQRAIDEANEYQAQYAALDEQINEVRAARLALLEGAALPLPGLTVQEGQLLYEGKPWDGMSGSQQLRVAVAIVRALKPECGFVLMDKIEQFDLKTLQEFGEWLNGEGLQVIATRVSTGEECSIIIEDGLPAGKTALEVLRPLPDAKAVNATWGDDF